jgi:molybdopterin-guanine dinucleotide biosynthesis protein A
MSRDALQQGQRDVKDRPGIIRRQGEARGCMHERDQRDERSGTMLATGVVLAGGRSRRMGQSKAGLLIGGEPLLQRVVRRLRLALREVLVVGSADLAALAPDTRIIQDLPLHQGQGPLAGLEAALDAIETRYAFVVACDMPFVAPDLVRGMVTQAGADPSSDALVLRTSQGIEPLHAVYSRTCLPVITRQLDAGERSLQQLLLHLRVREVPAELVSRCDPTGRSAINANTPEEWEYALATAFS